MKQATLVHRDQIIVLLWVSVSPIPFERLTERLTLISQQVGFLEKFHSKLEKFHSKLKKFHSKLEMLHSKLEKFHSKLEKFHSKLRKFHSNFVKIIRPFSNP